VSEIEVLEKKEAVAKENIEKMRAAITNILPQDNLIALGEIALIEKGTSITKGKTIAGNVPVIAGGRDPAYFHNVANRNENVITISASGAYAGFVNYFTRPIFASDCNTIISKNEKTISTKLIYYLLQSMQDKIYELQRGQAQPHVYGDDLANIKIPLPPLAEQNKIVSQIEKLETQIHDTQKQLDESSKQKELVLKKYL
jgi:type I restriction enzyme M protein